MALSDQLFPEDKSKYRTSYMAPEVQRMDLPSESSNVFAEVQSFDQVWLWALLGIETVIMLMVLIFSGSPWMSVLIAAFVLVSTMALMSSLKLKTRIDDEGIHYRMMLFHWKERIIPWDEIDAAYVRKYSPMLEYGGWGIRFGPQGKAFNVKGNMGIQIVKKDGKKILVGTQTPDEATRYLRMRPLTV